MPSYRIELSKTNRAGCKDAVCKKDNVKIDKGVIRFGSWVEFPGNADHGGWSWKHWGCVSGMQIQGMRDQIVKGDGSYDWEMLDGYDELDEHPDVQEKIRRVVTQGHIDDEDFNGDPEFNKLGQVGIRPKTPRAKKATKTADENEDQAGNSEEKAKKGKAATGKKRGRKAAASEDEDDEKPVPKKAKTSAAGKGGKRGPKAEEPEKMKDETDQSEAEREVSKKAKTSAAGKGGKRRLKAEEPEKMKGDQSEAEHEVSKKAKTSAAGKGGKRGTKAEEPVKMKDEPDQSEAEREVSKKAVKTTGRGRGRVKKEQPQAEADEADEPGDETESNPAVARKKAAPKTAASAPKGKRVAKKAIKSEPESSGLHDDEGIVESNVNIKDEDEEDDFIPESLPSKKKDGKGGAKKSGAPAKGKKTKDK